MGNSNSKGGENMSDVTTIKIIVHGMDNIQKVLNGLSDVRLDAIKAKQVTEISRRAAGPLGTPGATPRKEGELRISAHADYNDFSFGYSKEYAGHVEYGHRKRPKLKPGKSKRKGGDFVEGQFYLRTNRDIQEPIFKKDVENQIDKILNGGK